MANVAGSFLLSRLVTPMAIAKSALNLQRVQSRELLFQTLEELNIPFLFGVEGTCELPLIDGCAEHPSVQYIQVLHENIAVGAAMGFGRMTGKPGVCVLHVTPGVAHCVANLFNAWKARIPVIVIGGQQHTELSIQEPILWSSTVDMVRQYTRVHFSKGEQSGAKRHQKSQT